MWKLNQSFTNNCVLVIAGSGKIEREFDKLTPSRAIRRLRLMVKNIDSDGNGFVTKEELTKWVRASFR